MDPLASGCFGSDGKRREFWRADGCDVVLRCQRWVKYECFKHSISDYSSSKRQVKSVVNGTIMAVTPQTDTPMLVHASYSGSE